MERLPTDILAHIGRYLGLQDLLNCMLSCKMLGHVTGRKLYHSVPVKRFTQLQSICHVQKYFPATLFLQLTITKEATRDAATIHQYIPALPFKLMLCIDNLSAEDQDILATIFERIDWIHVSTRVHQLSPWFINQHRTSHLELLLEIYDNRDFHLFDSLSKIIKLYSWNLKLLQIYYYNRGGILDLCDIPASTVVTLHNPQFDDIVVDSPLAGVYLVDDTYTVPLPTFNIYARITTQFVPTAYTKNIWLYENVFRDPLTVATQLRDLQHLHVTFVGSTDTQTQVARVYGTLFPAVDLRTSVNYNKNIRFLADAPDTIIFAHLSPTPLRHVTKRFKDTNSLLLEDVPGYQGLDGYLRDLWEQKQKQKQKQV
jgi:hypothetical protein